MRDQRLRNPQKSHALGKIYLFLAVVSSLLVSVQGQLTWNNYPDVISGHISVYSGPALVNHMTAAAVFNNAFGALSTGVSIDAAIGLTTFQIPPTIDFSIITNKSLSSTNLQLTVYLADDTVMLLLSFDYAVMATSSQIYKMVSGEFYPSKLNKSLGYRSEYNVITKNAVANSIFASATTVSVRVLEGFKLYNPTGSFMFIDSTTNFSSAGIINTTFITFENCLISYIKYSLLFYDRTEADLLTKLIFQLGSVTLTSDSSIATTFFTGILSRYTSNSPRMFFGVNSFNFTLATNKKFKIDTSVYNNLISTYSFANISNVKLTYYFFAERSCSGGNYFYNNWINPSSDACVATCSGYTDRPTNDLPNQQCLSCHVSCQTCNTNLASGCLSCNASNFRTAPGPFPMSCSCMTNYVSTGAAACSLCSSYMTGCLTCSSTVACTSCIAGFTGPPPCTCSTGSIVSGYCNTVYGCITISLINNTQVCTICDSSLLLEESLTFQCQCITGTITLANRTCQSICGDNYVLAVEGCDDGNVVNGDGCSSSCTVETNWSCIGTLSQGSTCKIYVVPHLTYIGSLRDTSSNRGYIYYSLTPQFKEYLKVDYSSITKSSIPYSSLKTIYGQKEQLIILTVDYTSTIQNTTQSLTIFFNNTNYFWNDSDTVTEKLIGINAELTYNTNLWTHNAMQYVVLILICTMIIVFIASIFFEKWIGLELAQTFQSVFFILTLADGFAVEFTAITEMFQYTNGFNNISNSGYYLIYTLPDELIALGINKQFITNFNVGYLLIIAVLIALIVVGLVKRHYNLLLEEALSAKIKKKLLKADKVFTFIFSRVLMMLIFFFMFKIIFSFCIQLSNNAQVIETFPDQLNVLSGIVAFVLVFSMVSFVLYWFLLLPEDYTEDKDFIYLRFQKMKLFYPIMYLFYQLLFILTISIINTLDLTIYLVLGLQLIYFIALIIIRPYNTIRKFNQFLHNFTIIYNQFVGLVVIAVIIRWNSFSRTTYVYQSNSETEVYMIIIVLLLVFSLVLTILRLIFYDREASFKCCRKEEDNNLSADDDVVKKMEKEKYVGLADTAQDKQVQMNNLNPLNSSNQKKPLQSEFQRKKRRSSIEQMQINENNLSHFLNEDYIHWNKQNKESNSRSTYSKIKGTSNKKKAEMKKSSLEMYLELKNQRKQLYEQNDTIIKQN